MNLPEGKSLILFDGICNLCNASVRFIIKYDKKKNFIFSSLQSDAARQTLLQYNFKNLSPDSTILIENGKILTESDAVLRILQKLGGVYSVFYLLKFIPKTIRDRVYRIIAKNRYKWFGKQSSCIHYFDEYKDRFLI